MEDKICDKCDGLMVFDPYSKAMSVEGADL